MKGISLYVKKTQKNKKNDVLNSAQFDTSMCLICDYVTGTYKYNHLNN